MTISLATVVVAAIIAVATVQGISVYQCSDVNQCAPSTCTSLFTALDAKCINLGANNSIINATYARLTCMSGVQSCSPTKVYFNDSACTGTPAETLWTPCGTCLQFPPRLQTCEVRNDTFIVRVKSCNDNACKSCKPFENSGLPPATCYAHPGVPGLYLEYDNLEACSGVLVEGYSDPSCAHLTARTILPGQRKCFGGLAISC